MTSLTHQGAAFGICTTPQSPTLDLTAFELLTYVPSTGIVTAPSFRITQNILTQNTLDTDVGDKQGGFRQGEDSELVVAHKEASDAFVAAMNAAGNSQNLFAVSYELDNSLGANGTTYFALAKITGGGGPGGGSGEDFANLMWNIGISSQIPVEKPAA